MDKTNQLRLLKGFNFSRTQKEKLIKLLNESDSEEGGEGSKFIDNIAIIGVSLNSTGEDKLLSISADPLYENFNIKFKVLYGNINTTPINNWLFVYNDDVDYAVGEYSPGEWYRTTNTIRSAIYENIYNDTKLIRLTISHNNYEYILEGIELNLYINTSNLNFDDGGEAIVEEFDTERFIRNDYEITISGSDYRIQGSFCSKNVYDCKFRMYTDTTTPVFYGYCIESNNNYIVVYIDNKKLKYNITEHIEDGVRYWTFDYDSIVE